MKKLVSMLLVLAMLVTVFAGLAITASAADAVLTVYTQAGADGEKTLAKSYTAEELKKLAETKADGYGYQYFKKGEQDVVVTEYVTLDTLLTDADVTFADGDSLAFVCDDGPYTKFNPTYKDITEGKYSFQDGKGEEVPAAIALVWGMGAAADGTVADIAKTAKDTGSLRFVCGTTEADFTAEKAAGKRLPSGVVELIVVTAAKAEEKPAEEKPAEEKTGFTDVKDTDWFKTDVEAAVELGLMTGTSATTFDPKGVTTRAMVVATLYRLAGSPEVTEKAAFSDAVGHSMVDDLKAYAQSCYTDAEFAKKCSQYDYVPPFTKESLLYRELFEKYYPGQARMIPDFWMPNKNWEGCDVDDPSARVLSNYGASGK